jgi:methionine aminotransferase
MSNNALIPQSKLPSLGTTIFTQMSALAQQYNAINLSQGFPDFDGPRYLQERLAYHVAQGGEPVCTDDGRAGTAGRHSRQNG